MPIVFRRGTMIVRIYAPPREHPPPHVHVIFRGIGEVVVLIGTPGEGPRIHQDFGVPQRLVIAAYHIVADHRDSFLQAWEKLHGLSPPH